MKSEGEPEKTADAPPSGESEATDAEPAEAVGISPTHLGVARSVPANPSGGPDQGLSVAYQIVLDQLKTQPGAAKR